MGMDRLTLADVAAQSDPDGSAASIAKVLEETNPILQDMPFYPSNAKLGNRVTVETSLPSVAWGKINKGITRSKGASRQYVDTMGILEGRCEVDVKMKNFVDDFQNHYRKEADKFLRAMANEFASTSFYGDEESSEASFTGLQLRLETLATAISGSYVAAHHGSPSGSDYASIYICDWGENGVHGIYPPGSKAGLQEKPRGEQQVLDADGAYFFAMVTEYMWHGGISVEDPRHIARLANIDISQALADTSTLLINSLIPILNGMPPLDGCRRVLYTRREIVTSLQLQVMNKSNLLITIAEYLGVPTPHIMGYPIRACDAISATESLVS